MKSKFIQLTACLLLFSSSYLNAADTKNDLYFILGTEISQKQVDLVIDGERFDPQYLSLNIALTTVLGDFYTTLNTEQSVKDHIKYDAGNDPAFGLFTSISIISREDSGITAGFSLMPTLSIFGGFKKGKTELHQTAEYGGFAENLKGTFEEEGIFIGASYSFFFNQGKRLSLSLGLADMDGELLIAGLFSTQIIPGDVTGFSYAATYTIPNGEKSDVTVGFRINKYEFDASGIFSSQFSFDENYTIFTLGYSNYF